MKQNHKPKLEIQPVKTSIAFFGSPDFAVPILRALNSDFDIKIVVSQPPQPIGKHRKIQATAVGRAAEELGLAVITPTKLNDPDLISLLGNYKVELGVVAAYGRILPGWLLNWPEQGMLNIHGSLLPDYRGASPISAAILDGRVVTGITFMQMSTGMDEGDIITTADQVIGLNDTTASLSSKLSHLAAERIGAVINDYLNKTLIPHSQGSSATYTHLLRREDGQIDFYHPPRDLERRIRAYWPWPGVWGIWQDKRVKLLPGNMVQLEGKQPVLLEDFRHGYADFPLTSIE